MRLRCPHNDCPIDVPEDLAGERIRCPHCGLPFVVDANQHLLQAGEPKPAPTKPLEGAGLENQIYDGLPPLSVMIALRRRNADYDAADLGRKYEMTPDDWRALAAFEFLLHAGYQLRMVLIMGLAGMLMNFAVIIAMAAVIHDAHPDSYERTRALTNLGSAVILIAGLGLIWTAGQSFCRLQWDWLTVGLPWLTFAVAVVLAGSAVVNVGTLASGLDSRVALAMMTSAAVCGLAALAGVMACWRVVSAYLRVRPPEIHHRLAEALKYLE